MPRPDPDDETEQAPRPRRRARDTVKGKVRPHDPFELIRWLAYSQPDPRKALAELVQNSLDAQARHVRVTRERVKGVPALRILDDGEGVIPELDRSEALKYIATHIGHSRKRQLSPKERLELMTQGQFGIGLLGFWSLGAQLEMRSLMPGQRPHRLILHRDRPDFLIEPLRGRLHLEERRTEVIVSGLRREALSALVASRAADYLAAELRGQLLVRDVELLIEDRISRGRAQKLIRVRPPRFLGERVEGITTLPVSGHSPIRLEIYVTAEPHPLAVYCAGTLVADDFQAMAALGLDHAPWTDPRLTGLVDWPDFHVAPGSRRGVMADEAAGAFAQALVTLEPALNAVLESLERRREEEADRTLVRDLQRAFRDFYRQRPRYAMLPVDEPGDRGGGPTGNAAAGGSEGSAAPGAATELPEGARGDEATDTPPPDGAGTQLDDADLDAATAEAAADSGAQAFLLPPGPLHAVRIFPSRLRMARGGTRRARAEALDASQRVLTESVTFSWELNFEVGALAPVDGRADCVQVQAVDVPAQGVLTVTATADDLLARASIEVEVAEEQRAARSDEGIPKPQFVYDPSGGWRSRMVDAQWQVNSGHREFVAVTDRSALKLRYLAMLFAKEIVLRSHQDPRLERPLEQLVEVAGFADRNLSAKGAKGGGRKTGPRADEAAPEQS